MSKTIAAVVAAGDIVLFKSLHAEEMGNGADEVPAIVTRVFTQTCVNVQVQRDNAAPLQLTSIVYDADANGSARSWRFRSDAIAATAGDASPVDEGAPTPAAEVEAAPAAQPAA